jgi:hypothetical protein
MARFVAIGMPNFSHEARCGDVMNGKDLGQKEIGIAICGDHYRNV